MKIAFLNMGAIHKDHRVRRNAQWMKKQGHDVKLFQFSPELMVSSGDLYVDLPPVDGCPTVAISGLGLDYVEVFLDELFGPDVVIVEELDALTVLCADIGPSARIKIANHGLDVVSAGFTPRRHRFKVIYAPHEYEPDRPWFGAAVKNGVRRGDLERDLAKVVDGAVSPCQPITDHLKSLGIENAEVVTNAPYKMPDDWEPKPHMLRDALCIDEKHIVIHSGNVSHTRAVAPLIEAIRMLPDVAMVFVGKGDAFLGDPYIDYARRHGIYFVEEQPYPHDGNTALFDVLSGGTLGFIGGEPRWKNHRYQLPNKFFEMAFSRLPIMFPVFAEAISEIRTPLMRKLSEKPPFIGWEFGEDNKTPTARQIENVLADAFEWIDAAGGSVERYRTSKAFHDAEHFEAKNGPAWDRVLRRL